MMEEEMEFIKCLGLVNGELKFENNVSMFDIHDQDCCESHYLSYDNLTSKDFEGLEFNLSNDDFIEGVDGSGIRLKPLNNHPIFIPGYGSNNGYYSSELTLIIAKNNEIVREIDITDFQDISE
jgi:hypothetical protein